VTRDLAWSMTPSRGADAGRGGLALARDGHPDLYERGSVLRSEPQGFDQPPHRLAARPGLAQLESLDASKAEAAPICQRLLRQAGLGPVLPQKLGEAGRFLPAHRVSPVAATRYFARIRGESRPELRDPRGPISPTGRDWTWSPGVEWRRRQC